MEKKLIEESDVFKGAETAYMSCCSYLNKLIETLGAEKAFALMTETDTARGIKVGQELRQSLGGKDLNVHDTLNTIVTMAKDIGGIDTIIEETEDHAITVTAMGKCPIYEAGKKIGMDDERIEAICRASSAVFLDQVVQQLNPELTYQVRKFRSEEDGGCVEEILRKQKKNFTFTFKGKHAEELTEQFSVHFWDGGLDQHIEQSFLEEYGLNLDDVEWDCNGDVIINTDNAKC